MKRSRNYRRCYELQRRTRKVFTNGYYLEGFVTFYDEESALKANIPFVGFKGQFQNLPVLEKPIYSMKNGEKPTYEYGYTSNPNNWDSLTEMNFTGVLTTYKEDKKIREH